MSTQRNDNLGTKTYTTNPVNICPVTAMLQLQGRLPFFFLEGLFGFVHWLGFVFFWFGVLFWFFLGF